jgi:3-oxoacyl-[acyl-carrier-protein] synthase-1
MIDLTSWFPSAERQVCICAVGARTPLGFNAPASAAAVRGAISAVEAQRKLVDKAGEAMNLARDADFGIAVPITERMEHMLSSAIGEAVDEHLEPWVRAQMQCWIGLPEPRPGLPESIIRSVARSASATGSFSLSAIHVLPFGHASGLMGMQLAAQAIAAREVEICLVAGTDSYHDRATLDWLDRTGVLMSAENRNGFPPGEGAGACLLASMSAARRLGLPVLGYIAGAATSFEPKSIRTTTVCTGQGLTAALVAASAALTLPGEAITATYCDLNGERYRNEEFVYTLLRVQERFVDAHDYLCPADCWGDVGAASGPLFVSLTTAANDRGYASGTVPLLWAGSESGYRSAVVLKLCERSGVENPQ